MRYTNPKVRLPTVEIHPPGLTHAFHPYAAKFHPSVPCGLLTRFARPGDKVLDPFVGSGTTLVEALAHGCYAVGVDIHPLAVLASRVKTTLLSEAERAEVLSIGKWADSLAEALDANGNRGLFPAKIDPNALPRNIPEFDNRDHWFTKTAQDDLGILRAKILKVKNLRVRDFLWLAMSVVVLRSSRQDSETRYKAIDRLYLVGSALKAFATRVATMLDGMNEFCTSVDPSLSSRVFNEDIRERGEWFSEGPFDLVITSPPYANSYDYYLYHKQRMNWIGLDFRLAKDREIGSRLEFSSHKIPIEKFFDDMTKAFANVASTLAVGGRCVVVQGDSRVAGVMYSGEDTVRRVTNNSGLIVEDVQSMDLALTSKTFNPQFAVSGKKEHVVVLRRRDM